MGYRNSAEVEAVHADNGHKVNLEMRNLHLFSSGAFSNVYKGMIAKGKKDKDQEVVIKKTWSGTKDKSDKALTVEIDILKMLNRLNHKNIVRLFYTFDTQYTDNVCYSLVFEFLPMNLYQYLKSHNRRIHINETKMFAWQLFRGQYHLIRVNVCHRDIKPQNLLVDPATGLLKIGDFGSSVVDPDKSSQPSYHVTRYYRPPELLLGAKHYTTQVDVWSCGCVFAEMLRGSIMFLGKNTASQLEVLFDCFGLPTTDELGAMKASKSKWKEAKANYQSKKINPSGLQKLLPTNPNYCNPEAVSLLSKILVYDPKDRIHGSDVLLHPLFQSLFEDGVRRPDGSRMKCLSLRDLKEVQSGDTSMTGSASY